MPVPGSGTFYPNEQEIKQQGHKAYVDEQGAPDKSEILKASVQDMKVGSDHPGGI